MMNQERFNKFMDGMSVKQAMQDHIVRSNNETTKKAIGKVSRKTKKGAK